MRGAAATADRAATAVEEGHVHAVPSRPQEGNDKQKRVSGLGWNLRDLDLLIISTLLERSSQCFCSRGVLGCRLSKRLHSLVWRLDVCRDPSEGHARLHQGPYPVQPQLYHPESLDSNSAQRAKALTQTHTHTHRDATSKNTGPDWRKSWRSLTTSELETMAKELLLSDQVLLTHLQNLLHGNVELPRRCKLSGVLHRVRVAQHDLQASARVSHVFLSRYGAAATTVHRLWVFISGYRCDA